MNTNHSRKTRTRARHKLLVIVCEGEKTERNYFKQYRKRGCGLQIETPNTKYTDPANLVKFAKGQIKKYDLDLKNGDDIWCVFDCNGNININTQIISACKNAGKSVKIGMSNPSFEMWYLLHYEYYGHPLNNHDLMNRLKKYIPEYLKNGDYFELLLSRRETAIKNAKKLKSLHESNEINIFSIESNPSTYIYKIVENILKF
ncbi:MAG: RloB family protein [Methanosarcinaceae archaeon]